MSSTAQTIHDNWQHAVETVSAGAPEWFLDVRAQAFEQFSSLGWPAKGDTRFSYSDLRPIHNGAPLCPAPAADAVSLSQIEPFLAGNEAARLVFVDGHYAASLSDVAGLPVGATVQALSSDASALDALREHLERLAQSNDPLVSLNAATAQDGALVHIAKGTVIESPIHLLFVTTQGGMRVVQNAVNVETNAEATVLESHVHLADNDGITLSHTSLRTGPAGRLHHVKVQKEDRRARHIATQEIHQEQDSTLHSALLEIGGTQARQSITANLAGTGASCDLQGVFFGQRDQRTDVWTRIDHSVPNCTSSETFKGILDDESRGAFTGIIAVHEGASGTSSDQQNRNLLLSPKAHADATPQLEILNDDVRCAHGSTIGQLDPEALFFLRSRGIDAPNARLMLTRAFASEVIESVPSAPIRKLMDRYLHVWFIKHQEHL